MGHINIRTLRWMHHKNVVDGLNLTDVIKVQKNPSICSGCAKGKVHQLSFSDGRKKNTWIIGELIHSDVCGPMPYTSIIGEHYNDNYSGFVVVYLIKKKSEVFSYYRLFAALVKTQTGSDILTLRLDGGGKYDNNEFRTHLTDTPNSK
jgi:hypothetical protein